MSNKNIVSLHPVANVVDGLRNIADQMERGEIPTKHCTIICGQEVFHLGTVDDDQALVDAVFNMTYGIQVLMAPVVDEAISPVVFE